MTLVIVKIVTLKQCGVIWNKITVVADAASDKKENRVDLLYRRVKGKSGIFRECRSKLKFYICSASRVAPLAKESVAPSRQSRQRRTLAIHRIANCAPLPKN